MEEGLCRLPSPVSGSNCQLVRIARWRGVNLLFHSFSLSPFCFCRSTSLVSFSSFFSFFFSFVDFSKTLPLPTGCVNRVHRDPPTPLLTARSIETLASFKLFSSLIVSDRSASPTSPKFLSSRKAGKRKLFDEF